VVLVGAMNYALTRTRWGRSMNAVGGNREAARRAGINVRRIYLSAFVLCSTLAALGGVLSASRLASSSQQAGTGDVNLNAIAAAVIGGTSLFGGRGSAYSALLGIIVIQSIANGLTLLNLSLVAALHDHRRRSGHRRDRRLAGPPSRVSARTRLNIRSRRISHD
jgi:D-xylose transport system permease protein